ncbi:MAG: hypothetical protein AAF394_15930, partial [Planctomycetota bacterium]
MALRGNIRNNVLFASLRLPNWVVVVLLLMLAGCPNSSRKSTPELAEGKAEKLEQNPAYGEQLETREGGAHTKEESGEDASAELEKQASGADSGSGGVVETEGAPAEESAGDAWIDEGTWTTRRLVALSPAGPAILDLSVGIDASSLEDASDAVVERIAEQLFEDLEKPVS